MLGKQPRGDPPVADLVLLVLAQLRHRALVLEAGRVGNEGGVISEAALAPGLLDQRSLTAGFENTLGPVLLDECQRAVVVGAAAAAGGGDLTQELVEVLLVACPRPAVAGRMN